MTRVTHLTALLLVALGAVAGKYHANAARPPFDYFSNSWTVIGLKDYPNGTRISPDQELLLDGGVRVSVLLRGGTPIPRSVVKTLLRGWLPVVVWNSGTGGRPGRVQAFAVPLPGGRQSARYEWPVDGPNYVNVLQVSPGSTLRFAGPRGPMALTWVTGPRGTLRAVREGTTWAVRAPDRSSYWVPFTPLADDRELAEAAARDTGGRQAMARTVAYWEGLLARGTALDLPEQKVLDTWRASLVYQFIGRDLGDVHAGEGFYDDVFLRDGSYQLWALALAGYLRESRQSLAAFPRYQTRDGQFVSQAGQLDAHGYALWAFAEHYALTRDKAWLRTVYPAVRRGVDWLRAARRTNAADGPFAGLLPAAPADGENLWTKPRHIVGYDFWSLRGLQCSAEMATALGETADADDWTREAADYRASILRALDRAHPGVLPPSFEGDGTHWGDLECLFPTLLFPPDDRRVAATLREVRGRFGGGFVEGTICWTPGSGAIHPYMSQFVTNDELVRGNQRDALAGFYAFLLHTTATQGFPEGVYYRTRQAWGDTVPHLWAAGLYTITLRDMLVREQGADLHLSSAVPPAWLAPGRTVRIERAPTHFGPVSVAWHGTRGGVVVDVAPPTRNRPRRIVIHLPESFGITGASSDAGPAVLGLAQVTVPAGARRVIVRVLRGKSPPCSYTQTVRDFERHPGAWARPIPGLVKLPLARPPRAVECAFLDLSGAATTDPFTAPFCVPNAATFTGLPGGVRTLCGVPFRLPARGENGGRGLVVLRGAEACADLPTSVVVAVGRRARWAYFLGNVTGWAPGDAGTGPLGAVAEYVVRYADGGQQVVPLISGKTVDDWLQAPGATDAACGPRGPGWHLNVLGVRLRDRVIRDIAFRDLGTPASPVLAAVTLVP